MTDTKKKEAPVPAPEELQPIDPPPVNYVYPGDI